MSHIDNHLKWCLKDAKRLVRVKPDKKLAEEHLKTKNDNARSISSITVN